MGGSEGRNCCRVCGVGGWDDGEVVIGDFTESLDRADAMFGSSEVAREDGAGLEEDTSTSESASESSDSV